MLPQLREPEHEFPNELVVIGVHSPKFRAEREDEHLRKAVLRNDIAHPVVNDRDFEIWQQYAVRAWPTMMVIDPRGYVTGKHEGEFDLDAMRGYLRTVIDAFDRDGGLRPSHTSIVRETEPSGALRFPGAVLADPHGERLVITDTGNHRVLIADGAGNVEAIAGDGAAGFADGPLHSARFREPRGMAFDQSGSVLYVADRSNHAIRAIDLVGGKVTTVAGTGERGQEAVAGRGREIALASPWDLAWSNEKLWIAMAGMHQLWTFDPETGTVAPAAGTGHESIHDGPLANATFAQPSGITALDGVLYVADSETSAVRRVDPAEDRIRRLVGRGLFEFGDVDAMGDSARLQHPLGIEAVTENGRAVVYIADSYNHKIKRLDPSTRAVRTEFGSGEWGLFDGRAGEAAFWEPSGLSVWNRRLFIADTNNHAIRIADLDRGIVETLEIRGA